MLQGELYIHVRWERRRRSSTIVKAVSQETVQIERLHTTRRHVQCIWEDIETELLPFV